MREFEDVAYEILFGLRAVYKNASTAYAAPELLEQLKKIIEKAEIDLCLRYEP